MSRDNSAQRMTACPHDQAIFLDRVAGRPAVKHNGWPNGQKTVDAETLSGNCCFPIFASTDTAVVPFPDDALSPQQREMTR